MAFFQGPVWRLLRSIAAPCQFDQPVALRLIEFATIVLSVAMKYIRSHPEPCRHLGFTFDRSSCDV